MAVQLKYSDNWDELKAEYKKIAQGTNRHYTGTVSNTAHFARRLHNRSGFYIFNDEELAKKVNREIVNLTNLKLELHAKYVKDAMRRGIIKYVNFLRAYTGSTRPGYRRGKPVRKAHPGGWADITGYLNNSYRYRIDGGRWEKEPEWVSGLAEAEIKFEEIYGRPPRR